MAEEVYKLGDHTAIIGGDTLLIVDDNYKDRLVYISNIQPHELRKLAKAIEDHNRIRDLGEDSNHIA